MPRRKTPSREDEILKSLEEFDKHHIEDIESGDPVSVIVSQDRLKASVKISPPMDSGLDLSMDHVLEVLNKAGVKHGIDQLAIDDMITYGSYNVFVPVAFGTPATQGVNAQIEYKFNTSRARAVPEEKDEQGNVDHRELNIVDSVNEDEVIAIKIPARPGSPGMDVTGKEIPAEDGKDIELPVGDNTELGDDGGSVIATISGQPVLRDEKLSISPVFEVAGDVDYGIGNVDFEGSVLVHGNVLAGFKVRALDDIQVNGNVENATLEAGGNVLVGGGLYGRNEGRITAGDSVILRSVESGTVEADKDITIVQAARHSNLYAGENVKLDNSKGSIIGGKIVFGMVCDVTEVGSTSFTETVVEIGLGPKTRRIRNELMNDLDALRKKLDTVNKNLITLNEQRKKGELPSDKEDLLKKLIPAHHQLSADIDQKSSRLNFLMKKVKSLSGGRLRVRDTVHPGVKIITPNATFVVKVENVHCTYYEHKDQIMMGPY